jgi:tRNA threonylcarbamoyladenosine biosynthesis protein TsaE
MKNERFFISSSVIETRRFAEKLANHVNAGDVLALEGDLGAGKTTFAQGLAKGLGITEQIDSPTFTILKTYDGRIPLYHMDVYRVDSTDDFFDLEEYLYGEGVCLVEWASKVSEILPEETIFLEIKVLEDGRRKIAILLTNDRSVQLSEELQLQ